MEISEPRLRSLLRQAEKVANAGKRTAAKRLYRQIISEAPNSAAAWLGLAALVEDTAEKEKAYERVLALEPDNQAAREALSQLRDEPALEMPDAAAKKNADPPEADPFNQARDWLNEVTAPKDKPPKPSVPAAPPTPVEEPAGHEHEVAPEAEKEETAVEAYELFCANHPNRKTSLRCYTCGKPICTQCAIKTPVGYRCPECIREAEDVFFNARPLDYVVAFLVSLPLSLLAGYLVLRIGRGLFFFFIILIAGGAVGNLIARLTFRAVGRRRGRYLPHLVAASVIIGVVAWFLPALLSGLGIPLGALLMPGLYLFVATSSAFYQMK